MDEFFRTNADDDAERYSTSSSPSSRTAGRASDLSARPAPIGDLISKEAIINVMLRKGLCSEAELLEEEQRLQDVEESLSNPKIARIANPHAASEFWDRPQHPLRKVFAQFRWSRRLGTAIFGWKWKKVKRSPVEEERID